MDIENKENAVFAVDGDIVAYRTAAVCEDHFEGAVESIIDTTLTEIVTDTGISNLRIYLSGEDNFRYNIAKTKPYKGNRASMVRPRYLKHAQQYLIDKYKGIRAHGYEADDAIASDMVQNKAIHCGIDKDILQIPGYHYNYVKKEWREVDEEEAIITLYRQVLMGDNSDNIPGLPRIGEKKAAKFITSFETAHEDALKAYEDICKINLPDIDYKEYFYEQKALIEMITDINWVDMFTSFVQGRTEGFEPQEGDFEGINNTTKKGPKL